MTDCARLEKKMNIVPTNMTVSEYCGAMDRGEIIVNSEYQRSDQVWPDIARSYLIETIVLGYPMPKFSLYQIVDLRSRKTIKEIVDGQQRSKAIHDFFHDNLRLSSSLDTKDIAGKKYSDLDNEFKEKFISFSMSLDLFVAATRQEVVEVFRRMNSYTIPLNAEEHRHASFQGRFKWFINRVAKKFDAYFPEIGLFGEKQLVRMADTKLLAEICHAMLYGIRTTNRKLLDALYKEKDADFHEEKEFDERITQAFDRLGEWKETHRSNLMKPHIVYSLVLAIMHLRRPLKTLRQPFPLARLRRFERKSLIANLSVLNGALENPDEPGRFADFVKACSSKTNVREQRLRRFKWLCKALTQQSIP